MKLQQFFDHHGIAENPFSQEDAQSDHVFRQHCLATTRHPAWDKIAGSPDSPSTSIIFGEKGAGKTAIRLQLIQSLEDYNRANPASRVFIISYDDLNPFLDRFRDHQSGRRRKPERALQEWQMWDHMDAILSLATTKICNMVMEQNEETARRVSGLPRLSKRDLLLLAAFYDQSYDLSHFDRWNEVRRRIRYTTFNIPWAFMLGLLGTFAGLIGLIWTGTSLGPATLSALKKWWLWMPLIFAGWIPSWMAWIKMRLKARGVVRQIRVLDHTSGTIHKILASFRRSEREDQPLPSRERTDDRYELLAKLQRLLKELNYANMIVVVDRVDEPHLINGSAERMRDFLWSMLDNKFLKHPGIGFKMLLPQDVYYFLQREEKEFYERSRLDKQNLVPSLEWTGAALFDMANDRIGACLTDDDKPVSIADMFDNVSRETLITSFARLRVPRHLFRFLYRLLTDHCNTCTADAPEWKIDSLTFETSFQKYLRELEAMDRGVGTG